jgi:hypothetical protein
MIAAVSSELGSASGMSERVLESRCPPSDDEVRSYISTTAAEGGGRRSTL